MGSAVASGSGFVKLVRTGRRPQFGDIQAAATWGVAAGTAGIYLVQPFDWIKKTFFENSDSEQK